MCDVLLWVFMTIQRLKLMSSFISEYMVEVEHGLLKVLPGLTFLKMMVILMECSYTKCATTNFHSVALIGMEIPSIAETENFVSITVCAVLINLIQLEIPLTAFARTQSATATG